MPIENRPTDLRSAPVDCTRSVMALRLVVSGTCAPPCGILPPAPELLPAAELERLRARLGAGGVRFAERADFAERLAELRRMYEPYVVALARHLALSLPPWVRDADRPDNWQTSAWDRVVRLRISEDHF